MVKRTSIKQNLIEAHDEFFSWYSVSIVLAIYVFGLMLGNSLKLNDFLVSFIGIVIVFSLLMVATYFISLLVTLALKYLQGE